MRVVWRTIAIRQAPEHAAVPRVELLDGALMFLRPKVQRRNVTVSQNASLPWEREDGATKSIAYRGMKMGRPPKVSVDNDAKLPRHD